MNWFYMQRGNLRSRRILSYEQLRMMAHGGELQENDLLCSEKTDGKWVRAASIAELFPKPEPKPEQDQTPKPTTQEPAPKPAAMQPSRKRRRRPALVVVTLILAAIAVLISVIKLSRKPEPPPPPPVMPVETNVWLTVEADVTELIARGMIAEARELVESYEADNGSDKTAVKLRSVLDRHMKRQTLKDLYTSFVQGKASVADKQELIAVSRETGELPNLVTGLSKLLKSEDRPSPSLCRGIMDFADMMNNRKLEIQALEALRKELNVLSSEEHCMEIVGLYDKYKMQNEATALLESFVEKNPESADGWFELSAHLALSGREDDALDSLKTAMKLGGEEAKIDARRDPRFKSIKDTWSFRWNTR